MAINGWKCLSIDFYVLIVSLSQNCVEPKQKHERAQLTWIQSQYRNSKWKIRRCVCLSISFFQFIQCPISFMLSEMRNFSRSFVSRRVYRRILGVCDAGRRSLQTVSLISFLDDFFILRSCAIIHSQCSLYSPVFSLWFCYALFLVFVALLLLLNRFMLTVMVKFSFFHEAWNGGIQMKWFILRREIINS